MTMADDRRGRFVEALAFESDAWQTDSPPWLLQGTIDKIADAMVAVRDSEMETLRTRLANADQRLTLTRRVLVDDGYFTPAQIGEDVAPRVFERLTVARKAVKDCQAALNTIARVRNQAELWADDGDADTEYPYVGKLLLALLDDPAPPVSVPPGETP